MSDRIRATREQRGWSQQELARRAGVTRQLVSSIEAGRHSPNVAAALGLAAALGATVESLFGSGPTRDGVASVDGARPGNGPVRAAVVGDRVVTADLAHADDDLERWDLANAVVAGDRIEWLHPGADEAVMVAGCDPMLGLLATVVEHESPHRVIAVHRSTGRALDALAEGHVHAVVVHGPSGTLPAPPVAVRRIHLARWQVGLAGRHTPPSLEVIAAGGTDVIQREGSAGTQQALVRALVALGGDPAPPGPVASGHLDVARRLRRVATGSATAGITMEAAARAFDLAFDPIEVHTAELWIDRRFAGIPALATMVELLAGATVSRQVAALGGYDLAGTGTELAT
ncbi:MAG: helix-turn-helix domain-containing protein [Acidimicrobiales bacterium]|nr:helix-turn-helix domain-containing protein [Acidimicrobiales bacterium]